MGPELPKSWRAEHIQVSLFSHEPARKGASTLFHHAFGEEAYASNETTVPQFGRQGTASSGSVDGVVRTLQIQPGRCDLIVHPSGEETAKGAYPAKVEATVPAIDNLLDPMVRVASGFASVNRVAINCRFSWHFETIEESNKVLATLLPHGVPIDDNVRDFFFQRNVRRPFGNRLMNRLVKWSCEPMQVFAGPANDPLNTALIREYWAAVVHLDFNSVVPAPIFNADDVAPAFQAIRDEIVRVLETELKDV